MGSTLCLDIYKESTDKRGKGMWYTDSKDNVIHLQYVNEFYEGGKHSPFYGWFGFIKDAEEFAVISIEDLKRFNQDCEKVSQNPQLLNEIFHKGIDDQDVLNYYDKYKEEQLEDINNMVNRLKPILKEEFIRFFTENKLCFVYYTC